jgi:Ricin-type beta-trefoil lectin domain
MRIFMKAVASTTTVGLLAFGVVAGSGGTAFAGPSPSPNPYTLITGCATAVNDVSVGYVPNCTAVGGVIENPNTSIILGVEATTDTLGTLIDDQSGQGLTVSWNLVCDVNGVPVNTPGSYSVTSTTQLPYTVITLQDAVGSPDPSECAVETMTVSTVLPLVSEDLDEAVPFQIGAVSEGTTAVPGEVYQQEGTTGAGAHAELCADDAGNGNAGTRIQAFQCLSDRADSFVQSSTGQLVHNGDCVSVTAGGYAFLARCAADDTLERWTQAKVGGPVMNTSTGTCLTAPSVKNGIQLTVKACGNAANQQWHLPAAAVVPVVPTVSVLRAALHLK